MLRVGTRARRVSGVAAGTGDTGDTGKTDGATHCISPTRLVDCRYGMESGMPCRAELISRYVEVDAVFGEILTTLSKIDW